MNASLSPLRVLLLECRESAGLRVEQALHAAGGTAYQLFWERDAAAAESLLSQQAISVCLVGHAPDLNSGVRWIARHLDAGRHIPYIVIGDADSLNGNRLFEQLDNVDFLDEDVVGPLTLKRRIQFGLAQVHTQLKLSDSENHNQLLFENHPEPMWLLMPDTLDMLAANPSALAFSLELHGRRGAASLMACLQPERLPEFKAAYQHWSRTPGSSASLGVWAFGHEKRNQLEAEVRLYPVKVANELRHLALATGVRSRELLIDFRERQQRLFKQLLDDNRDAILVVDDAGRVHYANLTAQQVFGHNNDVLTHFPVAIPAGATRLLEWELLGRHGEPVAFEAHHALTEWNDEPMHLLSMRDITVRKKVESQLRILQRSLEASSNGLVITDARQPDHPILYVNPAFERMTGYRSEEVMGRNCRFLQPPDRDPVALANLREALEAGREAHVVIRNQRKNGEPFWNHLFVAPVYDELGELSHYVGVQNDISEQKRQESELKRSAGHDLLTGLPNRAVFEDRLTQACQVALRKKSLVSVLFVDLDGFKLINDTFGHDVGDTLLVEVARRMREHVRPNDTVARMGGDEFIILLTDLKQHDDILALLDRLIAQIAKPYPTHDVELHVTASIGVAVSDGQTDMPMSLVQQADLAMYKAKQMGRNSYQWYSEDLNQRAQLRVTLRNAIQRALENDEFELYYQPQFYGDTGQIIGVEALMRWWRPGLGRVSPAEFIPLAEETGQIVEIGNWILTSACKHLARLARLGFSALPVCINVSTVQLRRPEFVEHLKATLEQYQVDPRCLELELTETALDADMATLASKLDAIKALGVRVAIDDFGTGFSSLSYIKLLPIDKLKIDGCFVKDITQDRCNAAISQAIISMSHHFDMTVVAEGVETEAQWRFLLEKGCHGFQGHYFSEPMPFDALQAYLLNYQPRRLSRLAEIV